MSVLKQLSRSLLFILLIVLCPYYLYADPTTGGILRAVVPFLLFFIFAAITIIIFLFSVKGTKKMVRTFFFALIHLFFFYAFLQDYSKGVDGYNNADGFDLIKTYPYFATNLPISFVLHLATLFIFVFSIIKLIKRNRLSETG